MLVVHLPETKKELQTGNKTCFQHDMAYGKSIDLIKRTQLDKVLRGQAFRIESDPKYNGYQRKLALMVYELIDKKSSSVAAIESNYQLANKLHKEII